MNLKDIFSKDINRHFEGVIKADDQEHLVLEIEEYVITQEINEKLSDFFDSYNSQAKSNGAWLSGFFGSGKSHLLKILSYLLENKNIDGAPLADRFLPKVEDALLKAEIEKALRIPSKSILFNIDQKSDTSGKKQTDAILAVFMKVFNEMLGYYPKHGFVAELEHDLNKKGIYEEFKAKFQTISGEAWEEGRDSLFLDPDSFAQALGEVSNISAAEAAKVLDRYESNYSLTIDHFANRVKEWLDKQVAGFRLNFFVDEIGQYISENTKLMLNLQTIVESLSTICEGRAWVIVTSQEAVDAVLGGMGQRQSNDFSRIQDRFRTRINLTSKNADEVIQKRILDKKKDYHPQLASLFEREGNNLKTLFRFGGDSRTYKSFRNERHFIDCYPFLPYQFELFHAASIGLSKQNAFTGRHRSVGERSMLDVFRQVAMKNQNRAFESLMSFDGMFEGLRTTLRSQFQNGIITAEEHLGDNFAVRVLKALFLVKYVKEFKATTQNVAALLVDHVNMDIPAHEKKVQEALNLLEQQTYIQRNEDSYEYLTDEEKDIEEEIKSTELEPLEQGNFLARLLFDDILNDSRIRFEDNKQDYAFSKVLDDDLRNREHELRLHIISFNHEQYGNTDALSAQTMGKPELMLILNEDKRLLQDIRMYLQTQKYITHNHSSSLTENRKRILMEKASQNTQRKQHLNQKLEKLLSESPYYLNGAELKKIGGQQAKSRMRAAFQELVRNTYPHLGMLRKEFREEELPQIIRQNYDDLFTGKEETQSEAEREVLGRIRRNKENAIRSSFRTLLDYFEARPYGWYQAAILSLIARLYKRGAIEIHRDSRILEDQEVLESLQNNRLYQSTHIQEVGKVDPRKLKALKEFYQDFLHESCPSQEPKAAANALREGFQKTADRLQDYLRNVHAYPFLQQLEDIHEKLKELSAKNYDYFLSELEEFENELLDAREELLDPIEQFMSGNQRMIYDELRDFVNRGEANLEYIGKDNVLALKNLLEDKGPFRQGFMQEAKRQLDEAKGLLSQTVEDELAKCQQQIQALIEKLKGSAEYQQLSPTQQEQVLRDLIETQSSLAKIRFIPVLKDKLNRAEEILYPEALAKITRLAHYVPPKPREDGSEPVETVKEAPKIIYSRSSSIKVDWPQPFLAREEEVEAYLDKLKEKYLQLIKEGKRISL